MKSALGLKGSPKARSATSIATDSLSSIDELTSHGFRQLNDHREQDIFIVGFPKSGNTWMQNLVAGLQFGIDTALLTDRLTQMVVPNVHGCQFYKPLADVTCFKSHHLPQPDYRRVVYLVRDGRDALVSYWHMHRAEGRSIGLDEMVIDGKGLFPCRWHGHVERWLANPFQAELLTIRYEDLHADPLKQLQRFCDFAGFDREPDCLQRSIKGNSFAAMRRKEAEFGWDNEGWNREHSFIRRGKVGSYLEEMPVELIRRFDDQSANALTRLGYANAKAALL